MKIKKLFLVLCICFQSNLFGQFCANLDASTPSNPATIIDPSYLDPDTFVCINVFYHILRNDNGIGNFNASELTAVTDKLNEAYNSHNFFINNVGFDYIDDTTYFIFDNSEFTNLTTINSNSNAINIYIVDDFINYGGLSNNPGISSVVKRDFVTNHTVSHEFGHCFGLLHTDATNAINEDATNCNIAGDEVCDTPIDPGLNPLTNMLGCAYIGGGGYSPDTSNIMSLTSPNCMTHITLGQEMRMREYMASYAILQQAISANSCSPPIITNYQINGGNDNVTYNTFDSFNVTPADYADSYQWSIVPSSNNTCSNNAFPKIIGGSNANSTNITISFGTCTGIYRLRCKAKNNFGFTYYSDREIYVYNPYIDPDPCDGKIFISPNHIKNGSDVEFKLDYPEIPCDDNPNVKTAPKEISIYNIYGKLIFIDTMSNQYKLNSTQLPNGFFFVKLTSGNTLLHSKTIIKQ